MGNTVSTMYSNNSKSISVFGWGDLKRKTLVWSQRKDEGGFGLLF